MKVLLAVYIFFCGGTLNAQSAPPDSSHLFKFIEEWKGVPYKFGGNTKKGIDCSQFNKKLYEEVYKVELPNVCYKQYNATLRVVRDSLIMGDLVFFKSKRSPSGWHCGIYIGNGNFVHSPHRHDVVKISSLSDPYYDKNFISGGRLFSL